MIELNIQNCLNNNIWVIVMTDARSSALDKGWYYVELIATTNLRYRISLNVWANLKQDLENHTKLK